MLYGRSLSSPILKQLLPRRLRNQLFQIRESQTSTMKSPQQTVSKCGNSNFFLSTRATPQQTVSKWGNSNFYHGVSASIFFKLGELKLISWRLRDKLFQIGVSLTSTIDCSKQTFKLEELIFLQRSFRNRLFQIYTPVH